MERTVIKSDRIILPDREIAGYVIIEDSKIAGIVHHIPADYSRLVDVSNKVLMPGVIDPHVHINDPGRTHWEGFDTATRAAITGGITMLVDMPLNSSPVTTSVVAFEEKLRATQDCLHTNCGFWGGIVPGNHSEIDGLIKRGVLGFKAFLTHSGIDEFPNVSQADLEKAMPRIARHNLSLLVHCELSNDNAALTSDPRSYQQYLASRPKKWEDDAISLMIHLCEKTRCRVHIVHLSSAASIEQIRRAKEKSLPLTVETAQHYLYFSAEEIEDRRTEYKCAPPIRDSDNREQLWSALKAGVIDFVATDHSPAPPDMKQFESGDFMKAWGGISSLQWALSTLWTAASKRGCGLQEIVKWLCENPSRLIDPGIKKGRIEKGYDADLVVFDPEKSFTVNEESIQHKHKITPYLGHKLFGVVEQTWLGGIRVFDRTGIRLNQGQVIYPPGCGSR